MSDRKDEVARLRQIDAERIASLTAEERMAVVEAYRGHKILPTAHVPRKYGERLRSLGMAVSYEVDGWFRTYSIYVLSIFGAEAARQIIVDELLAGHPPPPSGLESCSEHPAKHEQTS